MVLLCLTCVLAQPVLTGANAEADAEKASAALADQFGGNGPLPSARGQKFDTNPDRLVHQAEVALGQFSRDGGPSPPAPHPAMLPRTNRGHVHWHVRRRLQTRLPACLQTYRREFRQVSRHVDEPEPRTRA